MLSTVICSVGTEVLHTIINGREEWQLHHADRQTNFSSWISLLPKKSETSSKNKALKVQTQKCIARKFVFKIDRNYPKALDIQKKSFVQNFGFGLWTFPLFMLGDPSSTGIFNKCSLPGSRKLNQVNHATSWHLLPSESSVTQKHTCTKRDY